MSVRWILSLLLTAHEFMARSNDRPIALQPPEIAEDKAIAVNEMTVREARAAAAALTECEQTWDPATHMSKDRVGANLSSSRGRVTDRWKVRAPRSGSAMIEATSNYYTLRDAWEAVSSRLKRRPKPLPQVEVLQPVPTWQPSREFERAVYAALILAGEPVNNRRLAELMDCSPGEASRRVAGRHPQGQTRPRGSDQPALKLSPVSEGGAFLLRGTEADCR